MATRLIISRPGVPVEERSFDDEIVTIGSDPGATLCLTDPSIAPEQAIVIREDGRPLLINRAPGTVFNGELLPREARRTLNAGDRIEFGPYVVSVASVDGVEGVDGEREDAARYEDVRRARTDERDAADARGGESGGASPDARAREQQQPQPQGRSFAAILDSLRTEEDSFYFVIESPAVGGSRRVRLEAAETMIGWDDTGRRISCDAATVLSARAVVRKDWSGVVALPLSPGMILVNGETVEAPRRLRDGDRVTLLRVSAHEPEDDCMVFHEPASLVVLDSLLPQQQVAQPAQRFAAESNAGEAASLVRQPTAALEARPATAPAAERRYFGYFTPLEVLVMVVGTLVTAAIIFIILELYA